MQTQASNFVSGLSDGSPNAGSTQGEMLNTNAAKADLDAVKTKVSEVQTQVSQPTSVNIDNAQLHETVALADQAIAKLNQLQNGINQARSSVEANLRRSLSDFDGVAP